MVDMIAGDGLYCKNPEIEQGVFNLVTADFIQKNGPMHLSIRPFI
jgi:hypothetical protein